MSAVGVGNAKTGMPGLVVRLTRKQEVVLGLELKEALWLTAGAQGPQDSLPEKTNGATLLKGEGKSAR